jgi:hypothetical protein
MSFGELGKYLGAKWKYVPSPTTSTTPASAQQITIDFLLYVDYFLLYAVVCCNLLYV